MGSFRIIWKVSKIKSQFYVLFVAKTLYLLRKAIYALFCRGNDLCTSSGKFLGLNFAMRKAQTFWVSAVFDRLPCQLKKITAFV